MTSANDDIAEWLRRALGGEASAVRKLVASLAPVIQARVVRALWRGHRRAGGIRDFRQEAEDMTQEVFAALFADDARALRAWDAQRGLSVANFVGLIAERQAAAILRTGRRSPWTEDPTQDETLVDAVGGAEWDDLRLVARDFLEALLGRLREELSPRGLQLFRALVVEERAVDDVAATFAMTPDAIYAWRARFLRLARRLVGELQAIPPSAPASPAVAPTSPQERFS